MQQALYDANYGYYMQPENPINRDFITAPELSPALAYACAIAWQKLYNIDQNLILCELGPGSGKLTKAVLEYLQEWQVLPAEIWLIELNAHRRSQQQQLLSELPQSLYKRCRWFEQIPQQPWQGLLLANEILDAQPFALVQRKDNAWQELTVTKANGKFAWQQRSIPTKLKPLLPQGDFHDGYCTEIFPKTADFIKQTTENLVQGAVIFIDYGYTHNEYYHEQRYMGTSSLFANANKPKTELFISPGSNDITAHVDFTLVAKALNYSDFNIAGYCTQSQFLIQTNAHEHLLNLSGISYAKACMAYKQLMFGMGEVFKVMLASKNARALEQWLCEFGVDRLGL